MVNTNRKTYKERGICGSCLLPNEDRQGKFYCQRCYRIAYLRRRIPSVNDWIAHYKQLRIRLEAEYKQLMKERKNAKSS